MENKDYSNEIDLRRMARELRSHKWLYIAVFAIVFGAAVAYVCRKESEYTAHSTMLIEESGSDNQNRGGSLMQMMRVFSTGGFASSSVDNELLLVNTRDVALRTVKAMNLNITCLQKSGLRKRTMFLDVPVSLSIPEAVADTLSKPFNVEVRIKDGKADIRVYRGRFFKTTLAGQKGVTLPCSVNTPVGQITLLATATLPEQATYIYGVSGYQSAADALFEDVKTDVCNKMADGIDFEYSNPNRAKAKAVLNTLMAEYNAKRIERKKETAVTELNFLTGRINNLYSELVDSEEKVAKFKTEQQFVDIEAEAPIWLETSVSAQEELLKASSQLLYYEQVLEILQSGNDSMLPAVAAPGEEAGSQSGSMVSEYNSQMALLLELRRSAKPGNHALAAAETRVAQMKQSIIGSFTQLIKASQSAMSTRSSVVGSMDSHLRKLPAIERDYINLSRDQQLKNELYAFLVEKRESALLKINSQETLGFIIDPAYVDPKPSLKKMVLFIAAGFVLGMLAVAVLLMIMLRRKDTVRNSYDLRKATLEDRTVECDLAAGDINDARALLLDSLPHKGILYTAPLNSSAGPAIKALYSSLANAGIPVVALPESVAGSNDSLLSPAVQQRLESELQSNRYVFAEVAAPGRIRDLAAIINRADSVAVVAVQAGAVRRKELIATLAGLRPDNLIIILVTGK